MVASEVAIAEWTSTVSGTPAADKMSVRKGVKTIPPPIPRSPARNPVQAPRQTSAAMSSTAIDECVSRKKEKPRNRCFGLRCLNQKVRWSRPGRKSDQANACPIHYRPSVEATLLSEHRLGTLEPLKETPRRAESLYEKKRTGRQAAVRFSESVRRRLLRRIVRRQCFAAPAVQVRHPVGADRLFRILREFPV